MGDRRRREALRRLGATLCSRCGRPSSERREVPDWTTEKVVFVVGLCPRCAEAQLERNQSHVARTVQDQLARIDAERDVQRAQMASSSDEYRRACAEMQGDVEAALGGWKIGSGW